MTMRATWSTKKWEIMSGVDRKLYQPLKTVDIIKTPQIGLEPIAFRLTAERANQLRH